MIKSNLHAHTTFCDGKNSVEDMVVAAIDNGYTTIGFSAHSYTPFDTSYCLKDEKAYFAEVDRVKKLYSDRIKILKGIELDYYGQKPNVDTDYVIGAVHYVKKDNEYVPIDDTKEKLIECVDRLYGGEIFGLIKDYYKTYRDMVVRINPTICGHFDLINKFNSDGKLFDARSGEYLNEIIEVVDSLPSGLIFEINVGNIMKNGAFEPYPTYALLTIMAKRNFRFTLSLDAHSVKAFAYDFDEIVARIKKCGISSLVVFDGNTKAELKI